MTSYKRLSSGRSGADRWGVWAAALLAALTFGVLFASITRAQDAPQLPDLTLSPCQGAENLQAGVEVDGQSGVWFPRDASVCMLGRVQILGEAVPYIRLLEQRLQLDDARHHLQAQQVALAEEQAAAATEALQAAVRRAREAEEALGAWYRSPALWAAVGAVVAVALEVVAVLVLREVSS